MKQETKTNWIADLRSGKYKQCKNVVYDGADGYCCLGVLAHKTLGVPETEAIDDHDEYISFMEEKLNITTNSSSYKEGFTWGYLAGMNDGLGEFHENSQTFPQIADWIEKNVPVD